MVTFNVVLSELWNIVYTWIASILINFTPRSWRLKDVSNDIVLITGGGSGLGRELALKFAKLGSTVIIWDINEQFLMDTKRNIEEQGNKCYAYVCDVSNRNDVYTKAEIVKKEVGIVTILINNAGIVDSKSLLQLNDDFVERTFKVNAMSHFWTCKAFLPSMLNGSRGHIVSIASVLGLQATSKLNDYCATKAAAISLMESLYLEINFAGHSNINFTTICPYQLNTGMFAGVENSLFSAIDPEYAAEEAMTVIRCNQEFAIIPFYFKLLYFMKALIPTKTLLHVMKLLDAESINNFTGHRDSLNNNKQ